jgi:hypothetical protein
MNLIDVNVLVYAFRDASPDHAAYKKWLETLVNSNKPFGVPDLVLSGFLRVVTHPKIFSPPSTLVEALEFTDALRGAPTRVPVAPGPGHWNIFVQLCRMAKARGNLIADAFLAALAIEWGAVLVSTDKDYTRFPSLQCKHPLE